MLKTADTRQIFTGEQKWIFTIQVLFLSRYPGIVSFEITSARDILCHRRDVDLEYLLPFVSKDLKQEYNSVPQEE